MSLFNWLFWKMRASGGRAHEKVSVDKLKAPTVTPAIEIGLDDGAIPNWSPPALALPDEYERRCLTAEFREEDEERTFRSDSAFADVLEVLNVPRFDDVIRRGMKLLPRFRDFDLPWEWVSSAYQETGQLDSAYQVAREGLARTKRKSVLLARLGDIEWQRGHLPEAVYALSQALHCYGDRPLDYNPYLLLSYVAEGAGLSSVAAAFLRQVDQLRAGTIRLPPALTNELRGLSRRSQAPVIVRVLEELSARYLADRKAAHDGQNHAEPETAATLPERREKSRYVGELIDNIMRDAHQKMSDDECRQLSIALVAICRGGEIQKVLNHPNLAVRAECEEFIKTILLEDDKP